METPSPTVFIVDDDDAVRDSLGFLLKSVGIPSERYEHAAAFLEHCSADRAGCLVLDVRMPGMSGLDLQQELIKRRIMLPIIFVTGHGDIPMAVQVMRDGAVDFLQKPVRDQDFIDCVNKALEIDASNRTQLETKEIIQQNLSTLTTRERQVLDCIVQGSLNKQIAADLNLSQRTIELHRAHVMEKMQVRSLAQLVRLVVQTEGT